MSVQIRCVACQGLLNCPPNAPLVSCPCGQILRVPATAPPPVQTVTIQCNTCKGFISFPDTASQVLCPCGARISVYRSGGGQQQQQQQQTQGAMGDGLNGSSGRRRKGKDKHKKHKSRQTNGYNRLDNNGPADPPPDYETNGLSRSQGSAASGLSEGEDRVPELPSSTLDRESHDLSHRLDLEPEHHIRTGRTRRASVDVRKSTNTPVQVSPAGRRTPGDSGASPSMPPINRPSLAGGNDITPVSRHLMRANLPPPPGGGGDADGPRVGVPRVPPPAMSRMPPVPRSLPTGGGGGGGGSSSAAAANENNFTETAEIIKEGWLLKRGRVRETEWTRMWCQLTPTAILCLSREGGKQKGTIPLGQSMMTYTAAKTGKCSFSIIDPTREYHLAGETHAELLDWWDELSGRMSMPPLRAPPREAPDDSDDEFEVKDTAPLVSL